MKGYHTLTQHEDRGGLRPETDLRAASRWDILVPRIVLGVPAALVLLVSHTVSLGRIPLRACTFLELTGYPCPFCGITRSFWAMAGGEWQWAVSNSPMGCLLYPAAWFFAVFQLILLWYEVRKGRRVFLFFSGRLKKGILVAFGLAVIVNWMYRLVSGLA